VLAIRQVLSDGQWKRVEKFIRLSFWGLNIGLVLTVICNLFPGGVLQLLDVLENGYWHARSPEFLNWRVMNLIEWIRMPADLIFIIFGVIPMLIAVGWTYLFLVNPLQASNASPQAGSEEGDHP